MQLSLDKNVIQMLLCEERVSPTISKSNLAKLGYTNQSQ